MVAPVAAAVRAADPAVEVHVTDLDEEALRYARMNLADTAGVHPSSVLRGLPDRLGARVSVIAAARDFEPAIALFGGTDGLDVARALIGEAPHWLAPHGAVLLEMHGAHVRVAARVAEQHGFTTSATDSQTVVLELRRAPR